jgi:hypothetical protein
MQSVIESGAVTNLEEFLIINRVQCHQQVLFTFNILDAGGKMSRQKIPEATAGRRVMVNAHIPHREAHTGQLKLWEQVLLTIAPQGWYGQQVGRFLTRSYKI